MFPNNKLSLQKRGQHGSEILSLPATKEYFKNIAIQIMLF
jgi:hypothetical protein